VYSLACTKSAVVLLALAAQDGRLLWRQDLQSYAAATSIEIPPTPVLSADGALLYVGLYASMGQDASVSARSIDTGTEIWSHSVTGIHGCNWLGWSESSAVALAGDLVILWDNFALVAVDAATGKKRWDTKESGFGVTLGNLIPAVSGDIMVVPTVQGPRSCDAMLTDSYSLTALRVRDGAVLQAAKSPSKAPPAGATPPVAIGGYWIFSDKDFSVGYQAHSTVFGVTAPSFEASTVTV
jgi:outer membrane protein assembly factor BamB